MDHQFNESIDGLFRQEKHKMRQSQASVEKTNKKPAEQKQNFDGQRSIDVYYKKKSVSNIQQKDKEVGVVATSDSDEDF